jgi:hypothetical protein
MLKKSYSQYGSQLKRLPEIFDEVLRYHGTAVFFGPVGLSHHD